MDINQFVMTMFKVWLLGIIILAVVCILYNRKFKRDRALTKGSGYTTSLSIIAQWRRTSVSGRIALPVAFLIAAFDVTLFLAAAMLRTLNYNGYELDVAYLFGTEAQNHQNAIEFLNNMAKVFTHEFWLFPLVGFLIFTSWEIFVVLLLRTGQSVSIAKWLAHHDVDYSLVLADGTDNSVKGKRVARLNNASVIEAGAMNEMPSIKKRLCIRLGILFILNVLMSWLFAKVVVSIHSVYSMTLAAFLASVLLCVLFLIMLIFDSIFLKPIRRRIASVSEWLKQLSNSRISATAYKRGNQKVIKGCFLFVLVLGLIGGALYVAYTSQELVYTLSEDGDSYAVNLGFVVLRSHISIPSTYNGKPVTSIKSPKSTCLWVTEVTLSEGITTIEDEAFSNCVSLIEVTIPDSVTTIGNAAFADCSDLTSITIPDSVVSIGDYAFADCESLASVTIGNSVTSISDYAFAGCNDLTSLTIPDSVTSIGNYAFWYCDRLRSVTISNSVTSIGDSAFCDCVDLESITIPNSVTSIGDYAFFGCESLTSITIPDSVTSIGDGPFAGCYGLESIIVANENPVYYSEDNCVIERESKILIQGCNRSIIPQDIIAIGGGAFLGCESLRLTFVEIGNGVTSIGDRAFSGCESLISITIPDSVTSIGDSAFFWCSDLETIIFEGTIAQWNAITFGQQWKEYAPATKVICSDGVVSLN